MLDQLQELEAEFGEQPEFLASIVQQREQCQEAIESRREQLVQVRRVKATAMVQAASRIIDGIPRRAERFDKEDELQAFLSADPMIEKVSEVVAGLRTLDAAMEADDVEARLVAVKDAALRSIRDRSELFEAGGQVIRLGPRHRFSVNREEFELTLVPRDEPADAARHGYPVLRALLRSAAGGALGLVVDAPAVGVGAGLPRRVPGPSLSGVR